jgi:hypothetical protein
MKNLRFVGPLIDVSTISAERRGRLKRPIRRSPLTLEREEHIIKSISLQSLEAGTDRLTQRTGQVHRDTCAAFRLDRTGS